MFYINSSSRLCFYCEYDVFEKRDEQVRYYLYFYLLNQLNYLQPYSEWVWLTPEVDGGFGWPVVVHFRLKMILVEQRLLYLFFITKLFTEQPESWTAGECFWSQENLIFKKTQINGLQSAAQLDLSLITNNVNDIFTFVPCFSRALTQPFRMWVTPLWRQKAPQTWKITKSKRWNKAIWQKLSLHCN